MLRRLLLPLLAVCACAFASCERGEEALVLPPPPAGATYDSSVHLGATYDRQIYYDFKTGRPVGSSALNSWDLAFEASPDGRYVFLNGGGSVYACNTHMQNMDSVTALPTGLYSTGTGWGHDAPSGIPDSTAVGQWWSGSGATKGEVYIFQTVDGQLYKMRFLSADAQSYSFEWAPLISTGTPTHVDLAKDTTFNFTHFSFAGGAVHPEPPKDTWDIVFTQYCHIYKHYNGGPDLPYLVRGALLNPFNTAASADSTTAFSAIDLRRAQALPAVRTRDVIGFDWKTIDGNRTHYTVNRSKNYIIHTRKGQIYKMHFLDWYNSTMETGNPSFEYVQLL